MFPARPRQDDSAVHSLSDRAYCWLVAMAQTQLSRDSPSPRYHASLLLKDELRVSDNVTMA